MVEPLAVAVRVYCGKFKLAQEDCCRWRGTIGLCCVAVAKYFGAEVELHARHQHQIDAGHRLGTQSLRSELAPVVIEAAELKVL